ncbi:pyridoxal-dependent decarboxylase [uncultured Roseibium sp.]|uniref:pyridoxal phosphate-dependent decarboxylase family protein n=1 Tax=uncultured Roseibium sp. TaxID=1936171 RepID=UPI002638F7FE|nr:pyridoxal-dependent decarboxylase [uncultured Roseibium sp.]
MSEEGDRLEPADWEDFGDEMHALLEQCIGRMKAARDLPWQPLPAGLGDSLKLEPSETGSGTAATFRHLTEDIMPYATGNTHPAFFGWVHGTGLPVSVGAELVAATMNSNCGGRDHGAMKVEQAVLDWLLKLAGFGSDASAILTSGTSQATILALSAARTRLFGKEIRKTGIQSLPEIAVYLCKGTHSCIAKALEVMGHGTDALTFVETNEALQMDMAALKAAVERDRANGRVPLAVIGTAGAVDTGVFDPIDDLAAFCNEAGIWLHVDAAFGFWTRLADQPWRDLCRGIEKANSIACDFHKWMSVPYDCGACMIYDRELHLQTFSSRPSYLEHQEAGLGGGGTWYCDLGLELSRGFRALKVWTAVKAIGMDAFGNAISDNCRQAGLMAELVEKSDVLQLAHPVTSNVCCFYPEKGDPNEIAARLQLQGSAVFSTTKQKGRSCLRAAIVNHRTTSMDIIRSIEAVEAQVRLEATNTQV